MSINGTPVKKVSDSVSGALNNTIDAGDLRSSFEGGKSVQFETNPMRRSQDSSLRFSTLSPVKKELGKSSKERPNFKSIQQAYLNPRCK